jgi:hypothetical protein
VLGEHHLVQPNQRLSTVFYKAGIPPLRCNSLDPCCPDCLRVSARGNRINPSALISYSSAPALVALARAGSFSCSGVFKDMPDLEVHGTCSDPWLSQRPCKISRPILWKDIEMKDSLNRKARITASSSRIEYFGRRGFVGVVAGTLGRLRNCN